LALAAAASSMGATAWGALSTGHWDRAPLATPLRSFLVRGAAPWPRLTL